MKTAEEILEVQENAEGRLITKYISKDGYIWKMILNAMEQYKWQTLPIDVSDMLCGSFEIDSKTSIATKCKNCGREKWEHPKPRN